MAKSQSISNSPSRSPLVVPEQPFGSSSDTAWLVDRSRLPSWARTSWIIYGYRPLRPSVSYCLATIFKLHNETGNIWTHLLGVLLFFAIAFSYITGNLFGQRDLVERMSAVDYFLLNMFFLGAIACMTLSTCVHTFSCHSQKALLLFSK